MRRLREIGDGVFWAGDCLGFVDGSRRIHNHISTFLVVGAERTLLVDTGHPAHWRTVRDQLRSVLGGRSLDYLFPTHQELPHAGNTERLMHTYPECTIVGDPATGVPQLLSWESARKRPLSWANVLAPGDGSCH